MSLRRALGDLGCVVGPGLLAGLAGTAAVTISQAVEMDLTGRQPSSTPAEAVEKVLGIRAVDDRISQRPHRHAHNEEHQEMQSVPRRGRCRCRARN